MNILFHKEKHNRLKYIKLQIKLKVIKVFVEYIKFIFNLYSYYVFIIYKENNLLGSGAYLKTIALIARPCTDS